MIYPDERELNDLQRQVSKIEEIQELSGKLKSQDEEKLMHSVIESDEELIDEGKLISESINQGIGSFTPDLIFEKLVNDYKLAKQLYGQTIIKLLTNYSSDYIEKNIKVPEFQREIRKNIEDNIKKLKDKKLIDNDGIATEKANKLSSFVTYFEELNKLSAKGFGEKESKNTSIYGDVKDIRSFVKTRYRDLAVRASIKTAVRRKHEELEKEDLRIFKRENKGKISIIYAIDASGSMKGEKIGIAKKAGIALAFKAIQEKNKVGIIVFGSDIKDYIKPTGNFILLLEQLTKVRAGMETDIKKTIEKSLELFPQKGTRHLILLTDALPTKGVNPEEETLKATSEVKNKGITVSLIGINLDEKGLDLAKKIVEIGEGRLYLLKNLDEMDNIILEDYYTLKKTTEK